ncbi:non-canonical purine NTP pyrophosphatase, RdgB/HAM1 family [Marvinbryantia formatexigens DSM 14469]|uniref:dITP/XTP pyrophosphatase n=1 Tax=Marvinbryantia formatexigens DSM 14469 TaxID=478749 RepID=C6LFP6_9FIRM|nr:XTP/dITP diphosphatase [Marvinbryantia formatexigens]EET60631.1 non-canonical purine NTP pyrophosphatase, RdgB/HAM1 family [Marvinbryantia formatexigens DSM 14469]UWO25617.1 XTP/dITP diphosphatase [Marvinbryantia formatexigens DSM 14469]SDG17258.1 XTP/dITP diphosphohydrolase [Marvinbryantia formatexigens]
MEGKIIFATGNEGKMKEVRMILADLGVPVLSQKEAGITADVEENGASFAENAMIKACAVKKLTDAVVLADDSGLEIDYLDGAPGIYSARYMGEQTPYEVKNRHILELLADVPPKKRTARFVCVIAAALPDGTVLTSEGVMEGEIGYASAGENGFGYDPVFYLPQYGCTSAEISPEQKNEISHRGKALRAMKEKLKAYYDKEKNVHEDTDCQ